MQAWELIEASWPALTRFVQRRLRYRKAPENLMKDCGQNVFRRVWKYRGSYKGCTEEEFWAWLRRICDNEHSRIRKSEGQQPIPRSDLGPGVAGPDRGIQAQDVPGHRRSPGGNPVLDAVVDRETIEAVRTCLDTLDERHRRVLDWIYLHAGLSERAIAELLECSPSYVHKLKEQAIAQLRRCMRKKGAI